MRVTVRAPWTMTRKYTLERHCQGVYECDMRARLWRIRKQAISLYGMRSETHAIILAASSRRCVKQYDKWGTIILSLVHILPLLLPERCKIIITNAYLACARKCYI